MSYRPDESVYGLPWSRRLPTVAYVACAAIVVVLVLIGENSDPSSWLFHYVVRQDPGRWMSSRSLAMVLSVGALASLLRGNMRGVRIHGEGMETREVMYGVLPKVRRYRWAQLQRIVVDKPSLWIELWDGQRARLPLVVDRERLVSTLERVAASRDIRVQGGSGPRELPEPTVPQGKANEE